MFNFAKDSNRIKQFRKMGLMKVIKKIVNHTVSCIPTIVRVHLI